VLQLDLDWAFQLKDGIPQLTRQSLIPGEQEGPAGSIKHGLDTQAVMSCLHTPRYRVACHAAQFTCRATCRLLQVMLVRVDFSMAG